MSDVVDLGVVWNAFTCRDGMDGVGMGWRVRDLHEAAEGVGDGLEQTSHPTAGVLDKWLVHYGTLPGIAWEMEGGRGEGDVLPRTLYRSSFRQRQAQTPPLYIS